MQTAEFSEFIVERGRALYRDMPWRRDTRPYYILVSELMLQQTQVARVLPKFETFITKFPDEKALAQASLADVLVLWSGLGYNRRARFLLEAARMVCQELNGVFPTTIEQLQQLPGVGKNTAGAIAAYAYNQPVYFIETNIRTVYIHHFFANRTAIDDSMILKVLAKTVPSEHPRIFYWALMDYGAWLKASGMRHNAKSKYYKKQSPLAGSVRQVRGQIVRELLQAPTSITKLQKMYSDDGRFMPALEGLMRDGLVEQHEQLIRLTKE